ncbi:L,D-transpeptidase [Nannocystaceae bacterium ST9]
MAGRPDPIEHEATHAEVATAIAERPAPRVSATPYTPASTLPEPIAIYRASLPRPVFSEPHVASPLRGRIEMREVFHVYATHEGVNDDGCSRPWAQVGESAWVCSKHTELDEHAKPHLLPALPKHKLLPFLYARHVRHEDLSTPKLPVYRHLSALRSGADPVDWLAAYGTYAFVRRARSAGSSVLIDVRGRVVPGDQMRTFEPSEFAGRDLEAAPVPDDRVLAWVINRKTGVYAQPDPESELRPLAYHAELLVVDERQKGSDRAEWIRVPAQVPGEAEGWIPAAHVRLWRPRAPPDPVLAGQLLIDVDLEQQVLTLWHEDRAIFATLIASGKPGYSTPTGLYRIITKRAYGKMASLPSEPEPYWVDAVPWTMYFDGRFALHGAFWHDRFGYRTSHGCINLSAHDAKFLFDRSTPTLPAGWLIANEHVSDPGTLVRIHKGDPDVPDRRSAKLEGAAIADADD